MYDFYKYYKINLQQTLALTNLRRSELCLCCEQMGKGEKKIIALEKKKNFERASSMPF